VRLPGVLWGVVMNVQSPVCWGRMECERGVLSTRLSMRFDSKEPDNAKVGGNDCGVLSSISVLVSVWFVRSRC
jgi:hypothetical protein